MRKHLGDILLEKGYINGDDLDRALAYQMRKVLGDETRGDWSTSFLLDVARTKYNHRDEFYLGKILTELKLIPETRLQEALAIQQASPGEAPQGRLGALHRIMVRMNTSYNLIDLLHQIIVLAAQLVEAESASLIVWDHSHDTLVIVMPTGPEAEAVQDREIPKDRGIAGWVHTNGKPVICNDTAKDERFYAAIDAATGYTSQQILCVPLTVKNKRLGAIEVINTKPSAGAPRQGFSQTDLFLLEMFSTQAAIAIEHTRLAVALAQAEEEIALRSGPVADVQKIHTASLVAESLLHQMRRSIIPLQGYGKRLKEVSSDVRVEKYRTYLEREMDRLTGRAEDMARFLKDQFVPYRSPRSLAEIIQEVESRTWVECRTAGITFVADCPEDVVAPVDRELLCKVLEQLFRNSRAAMPSGGSFAVLLRTNGQGAAEITVSDTGTGIDADPIEKVFEPFYTRHTRHGAGLGLPMARRIVELHGGEITAANRGPAAGAPNATEYRGAVFTITLPLG
jgi:signal transduction histidine kinase